MATIGLSKPYYAIYSNTGAAVEYSDGALIGKAVEMTLELEGAEDNSLYADNGIAESDNQFAGGTLTLTTDDLLPEPMIAILGLQKETITGVDGIETEGAAWIKYNDSQEIPYVGFGGIIKLKQSGAVKYQAVVLNKIQFANPGISAVTQGETIEWQTKELTATVMRDDSADHNWQFISTPLDTEEEAELAIQNKLNFDATRAGTAKVGDSKVGFGDVDDTADTASAEPQSVTTENVTPENADAGETEASTQAETYARVGEMKVG